jgi:glucose/arabinose dehydrogenase
MVGEYDATAGAAISPSFITGLTNPYGLALSGNNLFVANTNGVRVGEYDATTGAVINANFTTRLYPEALAVLR